MEKKAKYLIIALSAVAAVLLVAMIWIWTDRQKMIDGLTIEKEDLTVQMVQLQDEYAQLSSCNDTLNRQLDVEREKVEQLIERVKKTEASNKVQLRKYERELGTLRSIMKSYIVQIDSLNTLNQNLRKDAEKARKEAKASTRKYEQLKSTTEEYAKQVEKGSVIKGRGLHMVAITATNKDTERSSRTHKLKACISLIENALAPKGPKMIYIRIKGPDGILMTEDQQQVFVMDNEQMLYSAAREVDYQGSEVEICIYFDNNGQKFSKGVYTVDAYTSEGKLGSSDLLLR